MIIPSEFAKRLDKGKRNKFWQLDIVQKLTVLSFLVLVPNFIYWLSYMMKYGFGTDFIVDVYYKNLRETLVGTVLSILILIVVPVIIGLLNGYFIFKKGKDDLIINLVISVVLALGGIFTLIVGYKV